MDRKKANMSAWDEKKKLKSRMATKPSDKKASPLPVVVVSVPYGLEKLRDKARNL